MDILHPDFSLTMEQIFTSAGGIMDRADPALISMTADDTMVWMNEIKSGYANDTFTDTPFLLPYPVKGSEQCVIVCPGGAYLFKSMLEEGEDIAAFLNREGISAFVLWYRCYPYQSPLMFLDLQRAIRYLRYHAKEFGFKPDRISALGFSAGGNLIGVQAARFGDKPVIYPGYTPDEIDGVNGTLNAAGLVYPVIDLSEDKILACLSGLEIYRNPEQRKEFAETVDILHHLPADMPPLFLCAAQDDNMIDPLPLTKFCTAAMAAGISTEFHLFPYGGHGFGACVARPNPFGSPDYSAVSQWMRLYSEWLGRTL